MVKKWAVGAMINISGSIAINLGTNLMKLSHKVQYDHILDNIYRSFPECLSMPHS